MEKHKCDGYEKVLDDEIKAGRIDSKKQKRYQMDEECVEVMMHFADEKYYEWADEPFWLIDEFDE